MFAHVTENDWDRDAICASLRPQPVAWRFKCQRLNLVRPTSRYTVQVVSSKPDALEQTFKRLSKEWHSEAGHLSSVERKVMHPAYQSIIGMGMSGVPYVLRELKSRGGHWYWALHFMTGIDMGHAEQSREELRNAWLEWGRNQGYDGL